MQVDTTRKLQKNRLINCMFYSKPITLFTLYFLDYIIVLQSFVPCNRPNGWTEWAEFFVVTHGSLGGDTLKNQFSPRASSGPAASNK